MADKGTLLVVEDDLHLLQGIRDILEIEGYTVFTAPSGIDGLEMLKGMDAPPDLIISDIMMPRMDGHEFFDAVRANKKWLNVPFVFLTAKGEKHDIREGRRMGADDYIVKPMDPEDLIIIVEQKIIRVKETTEYHEERVSDIKRGILTILNHEFRTPLTYMVAYSDMLTSDAGNLTGDDLRTFLQGVNSGADRFRRLVENFIALVELETGEAQKNYTWRKGRLTDVQGLCLEALDMVRLYAETVGVTIDTDIPASTPPFMADYEYLRSALAQLLENAIKFSITKDEDGNPIPARIKLTVTADDESVRLIVQDWGRGIPEAKFEEIFEPFVQVDRTLYEDQGAGSGLAIVKGIMELHGGEVQVKSVVGEGSTFTLVLPVASAAQAAETEGGAEAAE